MGIKETFNKLVGKEEKKAKKPVKAVNQPNQIRVRVLKPVLDKKVGDEFKTTLDAVKRQIKHKSLEII